jgi:hypothetical protein
MVFSDRYAQAFWPLAAAPLVLTGLTVAVIAVRPSAVSVVALVVLAIDAALAEVLIWRALRSKWSGERESLWPWSERLRRWAVLVAVFPLAAVGGSWKAQNINGGTWLEGLRYSALMYGGLFAVVGVGSIVASAFNRYFNRPYKPR